MTTLDFLRASGAFSVVAGQALSAAPSTPSGDVLAPLAIVAKRLRDQQRPTAAEMEALANAFERTPHGYMNAVALDQIPIDRMELGMYPHLERWTYGRPFERLSALRILRKQALDAANDHSAIRSARATYVMAVQEGLTFGPSWLAKLLRDKELLAKTQLSSEVIDRLVDITATEHEAMRLLHMRRREAAVPLDLMVSAGVNPLNEVHRHKLLGSLQGMAAQEGKRPHVRWLLANYLWKAINLSRGVKDDASRTLFTDYAESLIDQDEPHFARWLQEAMTVESQKPLWWSALRFTNRPEEFVVHA